MEKPIIHVQLVSITKLEQEEESPVFDPGWARDISGGPRKNPTQTIYLKVDGSLNHSMYIITYGSMEFLLITAFISTFPIKEPLWDMSVKERLDGADPGGD